MSCGFLKSLFQAAMRGAIVLVESIVSAGIALSLLDYQYFHSGVTTHRDKIIFTEAQHSLKTQWPGVQGNKCHCCTLSYCSDYEKLVIQAGKA